MGPYGPPNAVGPRKKFGVSPPVSGPAWLCFGTSSQRIEYIYIRNISLDNGNIFDVIIVKVHEDGMSLDNGNVFDVIIVKVHEDGDRLSENDRHPDQSVSQPQTAHFVGEETNNVAHRDLAQHACEKCQLIT